MKLRFMWKMEKAVLRKVTEPPKDRIKIYVRPLKQIQTGQTLVLVGEVSYTKYETCEDGFPNHYLLIKISRLLVQIRQQV